MSNFLNFYSALVSLGGTPTDIQTEIVGHLTTNNWQVVASSAGVSTDLIPPATETTGDGVFHEVVRLYFTGTDITIGSYQRTIADAIPQRIRIYAGVGGAVSAACTIDSVTITGAAGSGGSTANDNLSALYVALKSSVDIVITAWDFWYNGTDTIIATNKTIQANKTFSCNANTNISMQNDSVLSGATSDSALVSKAYGFSVNIDLINGFIYFLQINSRSFSLAIKTVSAYYGPIYATYLDHTASIAATPFGCSPVELTIGSYTTNDSAFLYTFTHYWGMGGNGYSYHTNTNTGTSSNYSICNNFAYHPFSGGAMPLTITDTFYVYGTPPAFTGRELGLVNNANLGGFAVINLGNDYYTLQNANSYWPIFFPVFINEDIYKWNGTQTNENLFLISTIKGVGTVGDTNNLAEDLDNTTAYTSLTLNSTSEFSSAGGYGSIGLELFSYTGIAGNQLLGVTMGLYGSLRKNHFIGDAVLPARWFVKINNGAMLAGSVKPV